MNRDYAGFGIVSFVFFALFLGFFIAYLSTTPSIYCDPTRTDQCRYGGTCNAETKLCDCVQYPQYPFCDPLQANAWGYNGVYLFVALMALVLWIIAGFSFGYNYDIHTETHNKVKEHAGTIDNHEDRLVQLETTISQSAQSGVARRTKG